MRPKILIVSNSSMSIFKFRKSLICELQKKYIVYVLAPVDKYSDDVRNLGCTFVPIDIDAKGHSIIKDISLFLKIYLKYKSIKPNIILNYTIKPVIYGSLAAKFLKIKNIAVITGLGYVFINSNLLTKFVRLLYRISLRNANKVIFLNHYDFNLFLKNKIISNEKSLIINGEGVDTSYFKPNNDSIEFKSSKQFSFLLIARLLWDKGIFEYYQAAQNIQKEFPHVVFYVLGDNAPLNPSAIPNEIFAGWVESDAIKYLGFADDIRKYINNADAIVLPSYREGLSTVLMEGASMSKPLLASNVPGCKELIENNLTGLVFEPRDIIDLTRQMRAILNLPDEERISMGRNGRKKMIAEFDSKIIVQQYLTVIENEL